MYEMQDKLVEAELRKLGWGPKGQDLSVFREFRPNKKRNPHLPWEYTIFYRTPVWKWDFICPISGYTNTKTGEKYGWHYVDYSPSPGTWLGNNRWDFETDVQDEVEVARLITLDFEYEMDNPPPLSDESLRNDPIFYHKYPVQRVTDRPNGGTMK
jgi:hypothetical protein